MRNLLPYINDHFLEKEEYLRSFAKADTRVEGWFKGELIYLFENLEKDNLIHEYKREVNYRLKDSTKRKQIDFWINFNSQEHYFEVKALCISQAAGTPRNLNFYFRDDDVGLIKDFKKMDGFSLYSKFVLAFVYPNPNPANWQTTIDTIPEKFQHWNPITRPKDYPPFLFISLWKS